MKPVWYTDGACSGNGTKHSSGGFGVVCVDEDTNTLLYQYQEFQADTTNNRMEMSAIIHALIQAYNQPFTQTAPIIKSDSAYAVNTFTSWMYNWARNGWQRSGNKTPENLDLVKQFYQLQQEGKVCVLQHIRGHNNIQWNECCDKLATGKLKI